MIHNVVSAGAKGNGESLDTAAINTAIAQCSQAGGGEVFFPAGRYRTGTIRLASGVTLSLGEGATIVGTSQLDQYEVYTPPSGTPEAGFPKHWHRALILGVKVENVGIAGPGNIDGAKVFDPHGEERMRGPHTILIAESKGITVRDLSILDSANYAVLLEDVSQAKFSRVRCVGGWDGIHFRGWYGRPCRNISITDCQFYTGDDSIAGRYWEDVVIRNCVFNSSCNGIRLIGPALRLTIDECLFFGPGKQPHRSSRRTNMLAGICLQPGGWDHTRGHTDEVLISNVTMRDVAAAIHCSLKPPNTAGRIIVDGLSATGVYRAATSFESWSQSPIEHVAMRGVSIEHAGQWTDALVHIPVKVPGIDVRPLPAWGLYARKVKHMALADVDWSVREPDERPVLHADSVGKLFLDSVRHPHSTGKHPPMMLRNVDAFEHHGQ